MRADYYLFDFIRLFFFFKQKTAYEMRISDWSSDVCSSDLTPVAIAAAPTQMRKNPGATISAAASNMPIDSQIQCGSILASQSGMSGSRLALDRVARELADPAQSADQQIGRAHV